MQHRERIDVYRTVESKEEADGEVTESDGELWEEIEVWNFLNVTPAYQFRGGNPTKETFPSEHRITAGGGAGPVAYVTQWVAEELWHDLGIDLEKDQYDIEVVDVEAEGVEPV